MRASLPVLEGISVTDISNAAQSLGRTLDRLPRGWRYMIAVDRPASGTMRAEIIQKEEIDGRANNNQDDEERHDLGQISEVTDRCPCDQV